MEGSYQGPADREPEDKDPEGAETHTPGPSDPQTTAPVPPAAHTAAKRRSKSQRLASKLRAGAALIVTVTVTIVVTRAVDSGYTSVTTGSAIVLDIDPDVDDIPLGPTTAGAGGQYWFPFSASALPPPPGDADTCVGRYEWAQGLRGVDAGYSLVRILVAAQSVPVSILSFRVEIVQRAAPKPGTVAGCGGQGYEGPSSLRLIDVNLDSSPPTSQSFAAGSTKPDPEFYFELSPGESEVFDVVATTLRYYCRWKAVLQLLVGHKTEQDTIVDPTTNQPFVTNATSASIEVSYLDNAWRRTS